MKTAQKIMKAAAVVLLVFTVLVTACQSTGNVKRDSEAVRAVERGIAFFNNREFEKAIEEYDEAIGLEPKWAEAYIHRGYAYFCYAYFGEGSSEHFYFADMDYRTAAELNSKYQDFSQGYTYSGEGDDAKAIEVFSRAIQNRINLMYSYYYRGFSYTRIGEFQKAIADYTEVIKLNPDFSEYYISRANNYIRIGQLNNAVADADRAIQLFPNSSGYYTKGMAYIFKKEYSHAVTDFDQALLLNPNWIDAYGMRGYAYSQWGNYTKALDDYTSAINLFSDPEEATPSLYTSRSECYLMIGDYNKALADIDMALKLDPESEDAMFLRIRIREQLSN